MATVIRTATAAPPRRKKPPRPSLATRLAASLRDLGGRPCSSQLRHRQDGSEWLRFAPEPFLWQGATSEDHFDRFTVLNSFEPVIPERSSARFPGLRLSAKEFRTLHTDHGKDLHASRSQV